MICRREQRTPPPDNAIQLNQHNQPEEAVKPTDEMLAAFQAAWDDENRIINESGAEFVEVGQRDRAGLAAALPIAEELLRAHIAYRIRAELVCCDIYQQTHKLPMGPRVGEGPHAICYWGEAAARIAEGPEPDAAHRAGQSS